MLIVEVCIALLQMYLQVLFEYMLFRENQGQK